MKRDDFIIELFCTCYEVIERQKSHKTEHLKFAKKLDLPGWSFFGTILFESRSPGLF